MNSRDYLHLFYISRTVGFLKNNTTYDDIPKFFATAIITDENDKGSLPSDGSYIKWMNGIPDLRWPSFEKGYNEEKFTQVLFDELDDSNICNFCEKLQIPINTDKRLLCVALAKQFKALIDGKGEAEDIISKTIEENALYTRFSNYIEAATKRYDEMRLINEEIVPLSKFFVCNTIGEKERVFDDKSLASGARLDYPNVDSKAIRDIFKKRQYDNIRTLLIGSGGCGKSLTLQYLFLKDAAMYSRTGILPIFVELRELTEGEDLLKHIESIVKASVTDLDDGEITGLLKQGRCKLFFDGFDEIDPTNMNSFLTKYDNFIKEYENVQIIITSRRNDDLSGLKKTGKLYVWPFNNDQSLALIDKILEYKGQVESKEVVINYIRKGFLSEKGIFAAHPLLLTFVVLNYPEYHRFNNNHLQFYKMTYNALLSGHDNNKKPYDRVFVGVDNASQFSKVFREFCAITYRDAAFSFDLTSFEAYFELLTTHKAFENPNKLNINNFKHDVYSTACMMYEKLEDVYYIEPVFQKFLFADYYAQADETTTKELLKYLSRKSFAQFNNNFEALNMLYNQAEDKVKKCIIRPYLDKIFKHETEEQQFRNFLIQGFNEVSYSVYNTDVTKKYNIQNTLWLDPISEPYNIVFMFVMHIRDMNPVFSHAFKGSEKRVLEFATSAIIGDLHKDEDLVYLRTVNQREFGRPYFESTHNVEDAVRDDDGKIVSFGHIYKIDSCDLDEEPEKFATALEILMSNDSIYYHTFIKFKQYYKELKKELFRG